MHFLVNLLHHSAIDFWVTASVLGYCILPVVALAAFHIVFSLQTFFGLLLSASAIAWSTFSATRFVIIELFYTYTYTVHIYMTSHRELFLDFV